MRKIWEFISSASQSRTIAFLVILVIGASIPLTVLVAQRQQDVRQQAASGNPNGAFCASDNDCASGYCELCTSQEDCQYTDQKCAINPNATTTTQTTPSSPSSAGTGSTAVPPATTSTPPATSTTCTGEWVSLSCGMQGGLINCAPNQMYQTRTLGPLAQCSGQDRAFERCYLSPECSGTTSTPPATATTYTGEWNDQSCGMQGGLIQCAPNEMYQTRTLGPLAQCSGQDRAFERCDPRSACSGTTATVAPPSAGATLALTIGLNGVGKTGDQKAPGLRTPLPNERNPKSTIQATVLISDNKTAIAGGTLPVTLTYDSVLGKYKGSVNTPSTITGTHDIRIRVPGRLIKKLGVTTGTNQVLLGDLTAGDVNGDNRLNVTDHTTLLACWLKGAASSGCGGFAASADLNVDGVIDQFDYNLWLREFNMIDGE